MNINPNWAGIILLVLVSLRFFFNLYRDFHGVEAREPYGFPGAMASVTTLVLMLFLYFKAGIFNN